MVVNQMRFQDRTAVDEDLLDVEALEIEILVTVLSVGYRRPHELFDRPGRSLLGVLEDRDCLIDAPTSDEVDDQPHLLGRRLEMAESGCNFHRFFLA